MFAIILGITLATMGTVFILLGTFYLYTFRILTIKFGVCKLMSLLAGSTLQLFICTLSTGSHLCSFNILGAVPISLIVLILCFWNCLRFNVRQAYYKKPPYLLAGVVIYAITLQSSSFIEEEHQTWYYIVTTILLLLCIEEVLNKDNRLILTKIPGLNGLTHFNIITINCEGDNTRHLPTRISHAFRWIILLISHIFMRKLNQTGDKWLHLRDIGDWLNTEGRKVELSIVCLIGLVVSLITLMSFSRRLTNILAVFATFGIYLYRITSGVMYPHTSLQNKLPLQLFWLAITAVVLINYISEIYNIVTKSKNHVHSVRNLLGTNIVVIGLISMLLHKPHNTLLTGGCILTLKAAFSACNSVLKTNKELLLHKVILAYWVGKMFYFYQGNSNSLASIDLNPGFIGLDKYNFYVTAILITLNTFSGPLCALAVLLHEAFNEDDLEMSKENIAQMFSLIALSITIPGSIYLFLMVVFRSHLFIWSVFSPKLLYEAFTICLYYVLFIFMFIFYKAFRIL